MLKGNPPSVAHYASRLNVHNFYLGLPVTKLYFFGLQWPAGTNADKSCHERIYFPLCFPKRLFKVVLV